MNRLCQRSQCAGPAAQVFLARRRAAVLPGEVGGQIKFTGSTRYADPARVVDLLIERGAKIAGSTGREGLKQMEQAVLRGQGDIVTLLLDRGASADARTSSGSTLLHDAALKGHRDIAIVLLEHGARLNGYRGG